MRASACQVALYLYLQNRKLISCRLKARPFDFTIRTGSEHALPLPRPPLCALLRPRSTAVPFRRADSNQPHVYRLHRSLVRPTSQLPIRMNQAHLTDQLNPLLAHRLHRLRNRFVHDRTFTKHSRYLHFHDNGLCFCCGSKLFRVPHDDHDRGLGQLDLDY